MNNQTLLILAAVAAFFVLSHKKTAQPIKNTPATLPPADLPSGGSDAGSIISDAESIWDSIVNQVNSAFSGSSPSVNVNASTADPSQSRAIHPDTFNAVSDVSSVNAGASRVSPLSNARLPVKTAVATPSGISGYSPTSVHLARVQRLFAS